MLPQVLQQGLVYSLAVLGFALSLRMLAFADLTLEGSFVLGGVASAVILRDGSGAVWTLPLAMALGASAGLFTAFQHCFLRINRLLSGIITWAILYSVNLRLQQRPNESFFGRVTIFGSLPDGLDPLWLLVPVCMIVLAICWWLLKTQWGLFFRACGENENVVRKAGYSRIGFIMAGLAFSNALIALSGCLFSQYMGFSDVNLGGGLIVIALTSLILGEILFRPTGILVFLLAILVGSILCQFINTACLYINLHPSDHKGIVAILLILLVYARKTVFRLSSTRQIGAEGF